MDEPCLCEVVCVFVHYMSLPVDKKPRDVSFLHFSAQYITRLFHPEKYWKINIHLVIRIFHVFRVRKSDDAASENSPNESGPNLMARFKDSEC